MESWKARSPANAPSLGGTGRRLGLDRDAVTVERFRRRADYVEPEKLPGRAADYFKELYEEINAPSATGAVRAGAPHVSLESLLAMMAVTIPPRTAPPRNATVAAAVLPNLAVLV